MILTKHTCVAFLVLPVIRPVHESIEKQKGVSVIRLQIFDCNWIYHPVCVPDTRSVSLNSCESYSFGILNK